MFQAPAVAQQNSYVFAEQRDLATEHALGDLAGADLVPSGKQTSSGSLIEHVLLRETDIGVFGIAERVDAQPEIPRFIDSVRRPDLSDGSFPVARINRITPDRATLMLRAVGLGSNRDELAIVDRPAFEFDQRNSQARSPILESDISKLATPTLLGHKYDPRNDATIIELTEALPNALPNEEMSLAA